MKKDLIVITGPTACGKTEISLRLAEKFNSEIISADSMQIYKHMDIGTAKIKKSDMDGIKHYMIDEALPNENFSVAEFKVRAEKYIENIYKKNKVPMLVGGTGFYINAVIYNNEFDSVQPDDNLRMKLYNISECEGNKRLHDMLCEVDPLSGESIHQNNVKRVVRALEFFYLTGNKFSDHNLFQKNNRENLYNNVIFVLNMSRNKLYEKIEHRVDKMIDSGLIDEVQNLLSMGYKKDLVSMQGIGYKEIVDYFENILTLDEAVDTIKKNTRHFAKRQVTWFKHQFIANDNVHWIDMDDFDRDKAQLLERMSEEIDKSLNYGRGL